MNKYKLEKEEPIEVLSIDNAKVIAAQKEKLGVIRATRNQPAVEEALNALSECARGGGGNLLELAITASRARCTVGEITGALEAVVGRHVASPRMVSGAYASEYSHPEDIEKTLQRVKVFDS